MLLKRKRLEDRIEDSRQLIIEYKKFFNSTEGKAVFADLANHCRFMDPISGPTDDKLIGAQNLIKYILKQANISLADFEKLLKGEL